jgi:hypothetical protein
MLLGAIFNHPRLHSRWGHRLRALPETMPLPLGEVLSLAACHRLGLGLAARAQAFKTARLEPPPPLVLGDGLWLKLAVPPGEGTTEAQGRRRTGQEKQQRGLRTAWGIWDEGHWELLPWPRAPEAAAASWGTLWGPLSTQGLTAAPPQWIVSDGAKGLDQALSRHL